jgi:diadenosine tetraphosphate (Ap4A) HIT family hydrolase
MKSLGRYLFNLSKTPIGGFFVGFGFQYFSSLIPVRKMELDPNCVVFPHVRPITENHILVIPKRRISTLSVLFRPQNLDMRTAISRSLTKLIKDDKLSKTGNCFLIANGKQYQDVMQVHFHYMTAQSGKPYMFDGTITKDVLLRERETRFAATGGAILDGETLETLLLDTDLSKLIDELFKDERIKAFSLFSHVKASGAGQTAGINWSCDPNDH